MSMEQTIKRINELSRKQKTTGLSDAEKAEQHKLRQIYIEAFKKSLRSQLENIEFVDDHKQKPLH